ncbi:hypothetical protein EV175_006377 [Coemansia sp. RSA 1933]|nr:hypothetical protein EV175_006377 [Coemansia sp. RSA 1933]
MWLQKIKHPLGEHAYALYPLVTMITVIVLSCRINAMSRTQRGHKIPSPWTTVVSFGDSFSDSGNGAHITGGKYPSGPWSWHHRFTNGPNWIDNLLIDLGGKIHMRNFAHGGASSDNTLLQGSLLDHTIPGTHQQVRGFMLKTRQNGYPQANSTLYTIWTGANDCLALGGVGALKTDRKFQVSDIEESVFQDILQLERDSHNKVTNVLILTPPPAEDMPMVKHDKPTARAAVRQATASLARNLPHTLFEKLSTLGRATITDNVRLGPLQPPAHLPNHRARAPYPITHYITVDLPHNYDHLLPHEHNGTHPVVATPISHGALSPPLHSHPAPSSAHPSLKIHKRSAVTSSVAHAVPSAMQGGATRLHIMVYDAYGFIKHAEESPLCYGFNPAMMNSTCGEHPHCHDRVWIDDSNIGTAVHYWMARDINTRLHMWHMHNAGITLDRFFKNATRAKELELEMLGFSCPMRAAPTDF